MKIQFVNWFPEWQTIRLHDWSKSRPNAKPCFFYDWSILLGFWEIRHWHPYWAEKLKKANPTAKEER